jgi:cyclomaltodextrinase
MGSNPVGWFKDAIIYQIYIDRFAGFDPKKEFIGYKFHGGNIKGIIDKFDYLKKLGVNTLWLSPFYKCNAYHGYEITDFFKIDPRFGTLRDLKALIKKVHENGMKIIADFIPNHVSWKHPFFIKAQKSMKSPYYKWFSFEEWPTKYSCFLHYEALPKLNVDHPSVKRHLVDSAKYWLEIGLDGFRFDHAVGPTHEFWKEFRKRIKKSYPHAVLIGENWFDGVNSETQGTLGVKRDKYGNIVSHCFDEIFSEYVGELDGVLDFEFQRRIGDCVVQKKYSPETFKENIAKHYAYFPERFYLPSFLDNHDMDRFLTQCGNDKGKLKQAASMQFETQQPKIIFYGTEIGMGEDAGFQKVEGYKGDWYARQPMRWDKATWDKDLLNHYTEIIKNAKKRSTNT